MFCFQNTIYYYVACSTFIAIMLISEKTVWKSFKLVLNPTTNRANILKENNINLLLSPQK